MLKTKHTNTKKLHDSVTATIDNLLTATHVLQTKNNYKTGWTRVKAAGQTPPRTRDNTWLSRWPFQDIKAMQTTAGEMLTCDLHSPRWMRRLMCASDPTGWAPPPAQTILNPDCWGSNHLALTKSGTSTESSIYNPDTTVGGAIHGG